MKTLRLGVLVLALSAPVAAWCFRTFGPLMGDSDRYLRIATSLAAGRGFTCGQSVPYQAEVFRPPLYPLFLGALFSGGLGVEGAVVLQYLLYVLGVVLLWRAALLLHGDALASGLAAVILAVHAPLVRWSVQIGTEALALPLVCLTAVTLVRHLRRPGWLASAVLGAACGALFLVRTDYVLLLAAIPLVSAWRFRGSAQLRHTVIVGLVAAAIALPWMARNAAALPSSFRPLGVGGGMALWVRSVELSQPDRTRVEAVVHRDPRIRTLHDTCDPHALVAADRALMLEARAVLRRHAVAWVSGALAKLAYRNWVERADPGVPASLARLATLWSSAILALGWLGMGLLCRSSGAARGLAVMLASVASVHALLITEARYTAPLRPVLVLFAAYGAVEAARRLGVLGSAGR
jgi:hypothetical protein